MIFKKIAAFRAEDSDSYLVFNVSVEAPLDTERLVRLFLKYFDTEKITKNRDGVPGSSSATARSLVNA